MMVIDERERYRVGWRRTSPRVSTDNSEPEFPSDKYKSPPPHRHEEYDIYNHSLSETRRQRMDFLRSYSDAVANLDSVKYVFFEENSDSLRLITIFTGDRRAMRPALYDIAARIAPQCVGAHPDIHLLPIELADISSLQATMKQAYPYS